MSFQKAHNISNELAAVYLVSPEVDINGGVGAASFPNQPFFNNRNFRIMLLLEQSPFLWPMLPEFRGGMSQQVKVMLGGNTMLLEMIQAVSLLYCRVRSFGILWLLVEVELDTFG